MISSWLLEQSNYEDFYITSKDGLKLHNYLLRNDSTDKWIIAVHGYTSEGKLMAPYARKFKGHYSLMYSQMKLVFYFQIKVIHSLEAD